jgi:splicing factor 3A subunit 1
VRSNAQGAAPSLTHAPPRFQAAVDWHDFVVVETIDFYSEEDGGLPLPLALPEVIAQLRAARMEEPLSAQAEEAEMEVEMDEEERELVRPAQTQLLPAGPPPEAPEPQMKIVRNYKRAGVVPGGTSGAAQHVVSPITGELVPVDQMAEHMRISLIDPKWKVEREAMLGKLRGSTVASDEEIARNVVGLARTRPDIFSSSAADVSVAFSAEMERQKRAAEERPAGPLSRASGQEAQQPTAPFVHGMQRPPMPLAPSMSWPPMHAPPGFPGGMPPPAFPQHMYPHGLPPGLPPPMGMYGMPPPLVHPPGMPLQHAPLQPPAGVAGDEPGAKRQRVEEALIPEEDFAEAHPEPFSIDVAVPEVEGDSSLRGQTVQLEVGAMETIGDVKARLAVAVGVAASKQKMMHGAAFLKDTSTLAAYNFGPHTALTMALKARGKKGG